MPSLTWEDVDTAAAALGATPAQRRKWRQIGRQVPDTWRIRIAEHLKAEGTEVAFADFDDLTPRPGRIAAAGARA